MRSPPSWFASAVRKSVAGCLYVKRTVWRSAFSTDAAVPSALRIHQGIAGVRSLFRRTSWYQKTMSSAVNGAPSDQLRALAELDRPDLEVRRRLPSRGDLRLDLGAVRGEPAERVVDDPHVVVEVGRARGRRGATRRRTVPSARQPERPADPRAGASRPAAACRPSPCSASIGASLNLDWAAAGAVPLAQTISATRAPRAMTAGRLASNLMSILRVEAVAGVPAEPAKGSC